MSLEADLIVLQYLHARGLKGVERAFEAGADIAGQLRSRGARGIPAPGSRGAGAGRGLADRVASVVFYEGARGGEGPGYGASFQRLCEWAEGSLDLYRPELAAALYPIFCLSFLELVALQGGGDAGDADAGDGQEGEEPARAFFERHKGRFLEHCGRERLAELRALAKIESPEQFLLDPVARRFLAGATDVNAVAGMGTAAGEQGAGTGAGSGTVAGTSAGGGTAPGRPIVRLCQYSFDLLDRFLHDNRLWLLLRIVNERLEVQRYPGPPSAEERGESAEGPGGEGGGAQVLPEQVQEEIRALNSTDVRLGLLPGSLAERLWSGGEEEGGSGAGGAGGKGAGGSEPAAKRPKVPRAALGPLSKPLDKAWVPLAPIPPDVESQCLSEARERGAVSPQELPSVLFATFLNSKDNLCCTALSGDEQHVAAGFEDSSVHIYPLGVDRAAGGAGAGSGPGVREVAGSSGIGGGDMTAKVAGLMRESGDHAVLRGHSGPVYSVTFSPDWQTLLSASGDGSARLWSLELGTALVAYKGHSGPVWTVDACPQCPYFATGGWDTSARVWSTEHSQALRVLAGHSADVDSVCWHPNGHYVATGSSDQTVRLWDVATGTSVRLMAGQHRAPVSAVAISPGGNLLASADVSGGAVLWDLGSGRALSSLKGHNAAVWGLSFSGDGGVLASGGLDGTVRLWDAASRLSSRELRQQDPVKTFWTRSSPVRSLCFTRGNLLLACGALSLRRRDVPVV